MKQVVFLIALFISLVPATALGSSEVFNKQIEYLVKRDKILTENIANADTPGYKPKDLRKRSSGAGLSMKATSPGHMMMDDTSGEYEVVESEIYDLKPNGNGVDVQEELRKKSENSVLLNETITIYNKMRAMKKVAISGSGR